MTDPITIITGGASGVGQATAVALAGRGHTVVVADFDGAGAQATASMIRSRGGKATHCQLDVCNPDEASDLVARTVRDFGALDYAVNSAGVEGPRMPLIDCDADAWARTVAVNLTGVFHCMKYQIAAMLDAGAGAGSIVNIGSTSSMKGVAKASAYAATKHALVGLTKSAALEVANRNVRVNLVCPGSFLTPMSMRLGGERAEETIAQRTPMHRVGSMDEIISPILWLCSPDSSFCTGSVVTVDGGRLAGEMLKM
ncbi:SDR family NAD(P)-dependent oxidoreductase [Hydrogenophaga sp. BPS33]|uniref:SDR family NAD(P)-dependent oxidoreductase n=1 Tax=Hydrogenophaga sp. BPS33 TaxID=2651974 RepID=UPI00131FDC3F|nr:SDR family oxidoreductase [Hydrogenophaga sp. BPS33]QHE85056.1 SDR family oxidoreductase [Hydrogenophaga sp. BPS33]